jgi:hypothetical protein
MSLRNIENEVKIAHIGAIECFTVAFPCGDLHNFSSILNGAKPGYNIPK